MHIAWCSLGDMPYCFSRSSIKFEGHTTKNIVAFDPNWGFPDSNSSLNSPMAMKWCKKHKAALKRCPIVFQGYPSNFKVTRDKTLPILTRIERFRTVTPVWIHQWLWNDAQSLKQHWRSALLFSRSSVKFQDHTGQKIADFDPNWAVPDCNSSLNSPMAFKWCTKLNVVYKGCPIVFQGHPSNFKVTRDKKISNFDLNWAFSDCNSSYDCINGFEMMHTAWCNIEEVPYCFPRSPIKFQVHTGQNIVNLDPNLACPDCNSSLNSPMDLIWCTKLDIV